MTGSELCHFCQQHLCNTEDDGCPLTFSPSLGAYFHEDCARTVVECLQDELLEDAEAALGDLS